LESKFTFSADQIAETLADYLSFLHVIEIAGTLRAVERDPKDDAVLECAITTNAEFLVSGDRDLLDLKAYRNVSIITASEFLAVIETRTDGNKNPPPQ
jgi:uncharacterized protein